MYTVKALCRTGFTYWEHGDEEWERDHGEEGELVGEVVIMLRVRYVEVHPWKLEHIEVYQDKSNGGSDLAQQVSIRQSVKKLTPDWPQLTSDLSWPPKAQYEH